MKWEKNNKNFFFPNKATKTKSREKKKKIFPIYSLLYTNTEKYSIISPPPHYSSFPITTMLHS